MYLSIMYYQCFFINYYCINNFIMSSEQPISIQSPLNQQQLLPKDHNDTRHQQVIQNSPQQSNKVQQPDSNLKESNLNQLQVQQKEEENKEVENISVQYSEQLGNLNQSQNYRNLKQSNINPQKTVINMKQKVNQTQGNQKDSQEQNQEQEEQQKEDESIVKEKQHIEVEQISTIKKEEKQDNENNGEQVEEFKEQVDINLEEDKEKNIVRNSDIKQESSEIVQQQSNVKIQKQSSQKQFSEQPKYEQQPISIIQQISHPTHPYSPLSNFHLLFDHYSKISYTTGKNMTFDRLQHQTHILNINKFMILCKDLKLTKKVSVNELMKIFNKSGSSHLELNFDEFMVSMGKIAEKGWKGEKRMEELEKYIGIHDEEEWKGVCKELHINTAKVVSSNKSNIRIKTRKYQSKQQSRIISSDIQLQPDTDKLNHQPLLKPLSKLAAPPKAFSKPLPPPTNPYNPPSRNKILSHIQKPLSQQNKVQSYSQIRNINKSVALRSHHATQRQSSSEYDINLIPTHSKETHRYGKRSSGAADKYKLNQIINDARGEVSRSTHEGKEIIGGVRLREMNLKRKEEQENESFLNNLVGDTEDDEFLRELEKESMRVRSKREVRGVANRLSEGRKGELVLNRYKRQSRSKIRDIEDLEEN